MFFLKFVSFLPDTSFSTCLILLVRSSTQHSTLCLLHSAR